MELKIKLLELTAGMPVAMLNEKTAEKLGVHAKDRISIKISSNTKKEIRTIVDVLKGNDIVKENQIAISSEIKKKMNLRNGQKVEVFLALAPKSLTFIKKKLDGKDLKRKEIYEIINDVVNNSLSEAEISLFVSAMYKNGMSMKETVYLINAILKSSSILNLNTRPVVDKHSIGGIAGNRTTPIVVSICCASGLIMPKNSSRAITSAAGTADVIEAIADVEFSIKKLRQIIKKTGGCMVWGGSWGMVPADSKIIQIEKILKIDPEAQMLASIMSKKLAVESKHILIDIPYGRGAKVSKNKALRLKRKFLQLGRHFDLDMRVILTDGSQPIGNGIGPVLELIDIIKILDPERRDGPKDLEEKSLFIAGELLEMAKKAKKGEGVEMARCILYSGKAFRKFKQIIKAQNGNLNKIKRLKPAEFKKEIFAKKTGTVVRIENKKINTLARIAGCPTDKKSGVYLHHKENESVKKREKLLTIYSESKSRLREAFKFYKDQKPIKVK